MTTDIWNPTQKSIQSSYVINMTFLQSIIQLMEDNDSLSVESLLTHEEQQKHRFIMQLPKEQWFAIKDSLSVDDIHLLIKFFTLAEMQFSDWTGKEKSPVIWLTKILRQKGKILEKELLLWIKENSSNKFLPYGAL
ncbi:hypothetical protein AB835_09585 [Candidatus Endobugula sertula]|uniref:Uncharacterized protein n=1 Tax=Candidatus Endobugula sertula TaxID=62101 RepID=A0A1D2QP08_9GAMM|nr:hypothetical protein AB835_09585 [Candidatus Endobugula sertula]